jgi:hypothetical protein
MKINLLIDNPNLLPGYLNIDPTIKNPANGLIRADLGYLEEFIDDGECEEIIANHVMCYFDGNQIDRILSGWISKLAKGGLLKIVETDLHLVFRKYQTGELDIDKFNELLYGSQNKKWDYKKSFFDIKTLRDCLAGNGFQIKEVRKDSDSLSFQVTAEKL